MIKKNNEVKVFVADEVAKQLIGYIASRHYFEPELEQITTEVQESAESKFSVEVDGEAVLQIVRLFDLARGWYCEIEWNSQHPFDQLEECFHERFPSTDPIQVKQLCSDPILTKKVKRFVFDYFISSIRNSCGLLQDEDYNDIPSLGRLLDEMSGEIEYIQKVFISPAEPASKAA